MNDYSSDETERAAPVRPAKPSTVPSWVMVGFVFGALFVWALPKREARPAVAAEPPRSTLPERPTPRMLTEVENVFVTWGHYAVWENERTEFALWNGRKMEFSDSYEVLRTGETLYFRSIPHLTRPLQSTELPANCPAQFTDTQAEHEKQVREHNERTFRALSEAAKQNIPTLGPPPVETPK